VGYSETLGKFSTTAIAKEDEADLLGSGCCLVGETTP
tara:strand:- start:1144 stop:1254 length:111 start_codon:yes stop_codon:yes gene_type:complete